MKLLLRYTIEIALRKLTYNSWDAGSIETAAFLKNAYLHEVHNAQFHFLNLLST